VLVAPRSITIIPALVISKFWQGIKRGDSRIQHLENAETGQEPASLYDHQLPPNSLYARQLPWSRPTNTSTSWKS
jgi:hypothetical protein